MLPRQKLVCQNLAWGRRPLAKCTWQISLGLVSTSFCRNLNLFYGIHFPIWNSSEGEVGSSNINNDINKSGNRKWIETHVWPPLLCTNIGKNKGKLHKSLILTGKSCRNYTQYHQLAHWKICRCLCLLLVDLTNRFNIFFVLGGFCTSPWW